jgi:hypothetical protein
MELYDSFFGSRNDPSTYAPPSTSTTTRYYGSPVPNASPQVQAYYAHLATERPYVTTSVEDTGDHLDSTVTASNIEEHHYGFGGIDRGFANSAEGELWERNIHNIGTYAAAGEADIQGRSKALLIGPDLQATIGQQGTQRGGNALRQVRSAL